MCCLRVPLCVKLFPHRSHMCGFSPVWIFMCSWSFFFCLKLFLHWSHVNGFSPVWIIMWSLRVALCVKHFPHRSHLCGFSPVWIFMCSLRFFFCLKLFSHWSHVNGFSPVWILKWTSILCLYGNDFPHWGQVEILLALLLRKNSLSFCEQLMTWWFSSPSFSSSLSSLSSIRSEMKVKKLHFKQIAINEWMNDRNVKGKDICYTNVWLVTFSLSLPWLDRASSCLPQGQWLGFLARQILWSNVGLEVQLLVWSLERVSAINHFIYAIYVSPQSLVPQMLNASVLKYRIKDISSLRKYY